MSLILSSSDAQIVRNRDTYREYIFYTNRRLRPDTFKLIHSLEFTYGGGTIDNIYDVSFQVGEGGDKFYIGTFHQTSEKQVETFTRAQQLFTLDRDYYTESIFVVRIEPTYFSSPALSDNIGSNTVTTITNTVVVESQHNLLSLGGDTTGTNLDAIEVGALLFDTDASYTHIAGGPGDYLNVLPVIQHLTQNHTKWKLSFPVYAFPSAAEQTLFYMRADTPEETAIRLLVNTSNQLVLERYDNYSNTQVTTYARPAGYDTLMNEAGKLQYSTADGVSSPPGFDGTVVGTLTNEVFERRNAIVFPVGSSERYIDLSAYTTGPHIQDAVTFSFWVDNFVKNVPQCVFSIKNTAVGDLDERFSITLVNKDEGLQILMSLRALGETVNDRKVVVRKDIEPITQEWTHFAIVIASGRYEIYRDGIECSYNQRNEVKPGATETLYGTFQEIEADDEVYIGSYRFVEETLGEGGSADYNALLTGGNVTAQYLFPDFTDETGNGFDGTIIPASTFTETVVNDGTHERNMIVSNGLSRVDFTSHANNICSGSTMTISFWYNCSGIDRSSIGYFGTLMQIQEGTIKNILTIYDKFTSVIPTLQFGVDANGNGRQQINTEIEFDDTVWNHIVFSFIDTSPWYRIHINGAEIPVAALAGSLNIGSKTITQMHLFDNLNPFVGWRELYLPAGAGISNFLFFDRALTPVEIGYLYTGDTLPQPSFSASFIQPFQGRLSDFQMFPRALSATEIADLGTPETESTETTITGTKFISSVDNVTGSWKTVVLSNDENNLFATVDTDSTGPLPGHTFEASEARFGGPTTGDAFDGLIGPIETSYETVEVVTTIDSSAADNIDPWTLKMRIEEI